MRPIMTAAELRTHHVGDHGRNYALSDDGYGDMGVANKLGWHALSGWGRDGWEIGDWPYVIVYTRTVPASLVAALQEGVKGSYELLSICEGDHSIYRFAEEDDRTAAIDYLFLWYSPLHSFAPITWEQREQLDRGEITVDDKWRGPYRADRTVVPRPPGRE